MEVSFAAHSAVNYRQADGTISRARPIRGMIGRVRLSDALPNHSRRPRWSARLGIYSVALAAKALDAVICANGRGIALCCTWRIEKRRIGFYLGGADIGRCGATLLRLADPAR